MDDISHPFQSHQTYHVTFLLLPCTHQGHLDHLKCLCGYICKFHGAIHFCTHIPPHENTFGSQPLYFAWQDTIYGPISEEIPPNAPPPHGSPVCHTYFVDANLMHDGVSGHSATGINHLLNQTLGWVRGLALINTKSRPPPMDLSFWWLARP